MDKRKRNRVLTTQRIVDALEQVLSEKGLDGVGINAVAEKAGVSKVTDLSVLWESGRGCWTIMFIWADYSLNIHLR